MIHVSRWGAAIAIAGAIVACGANEHEPTMAQAGAGNPLPVPPAEGESAPSEGTGVPLDGGLAWCEAPKPDELRTSADLAPQTTLRIYAGYCVPPEGFHRACDDAGLPVYVPPCGDEFTGTRLEIANGGKPPSVTFRAHAIDILQGPLPGGAWPIGPNERGIVVKAQLKIGDSLREDGRVVAIAGKPDEWSVPSDEFSEVAANPSSGTFTFWRKAYCIDPIGCMPARWEASRGGVRLSVAERDMYDLARKRTRGQMPTFRQETPTCPTPAILAAARIYTYSRLLGDPEKSALADFDQLVKGLSTKGCPRAHSGPVKSLGAIRSEMVQSVKKLGSRR